MADVYRDEGDDHIRLYACDYEESERLTVAEALEVAQKLTEQALIIEADMAADRVLCATLGHDWDGGFNYWRSPGEGQPATIKIHIEKCQRRYCDAEREFEGWRDEPETQQ